MEAPYTYTPIGDPNCGIRLLSVTSVANGSVSISLREVPSLTSEHYNCLSYTWGAQHPENEVACDGRPLAIRQNIYNALVHLHKLVPDKLSAIWIDAVCIDQRNDAEKPPQLARMHEIYAGADAVLVWLGGAPADPAAIPRFEDVVRRIEASFPGADGSAFWDCMLQLNDGASADAANLPLVHEIDAEGWLAVHDLMHRKYFRRQWIWQEVIASRDDPVVFCGDSLVSWEGLRKASHAFTIFGSTRLIGEGRMPQADLGGMRTVNLPYQLAWYRDQYRQSGQSWMRSRFGKLVLQGNRNSYTCWDERDRLYAMTGICGFDRLASWDYGRPFEELYLHFWCDCLSRTNEVNLLTFVEGVSARASRPRMSKDPEGGIYEAKIPSWVPDLRASLEPDSLWAYFEHCDNFNISKGLVERSARPDGEPGHGMRVDEENGRLMLSGYLLDIIQSSAQSAFEILDMVKHILSNPNGEEHSHQGAVEALWKSMALLTSRNVDQEFPVSDVMALAARRWLLQLSSGAASLRSDVQRLDANSIVFPSKGQNLPRSGTHEEAALTWGMRGMKLFHTKDNWVGKGPESLQARDELWIIPGAVVPFVLRPVLNGERVFVGQAYIHGIMSGEACEILKGREPVEVVLV